MPTSTESRSAPGRGLGPRARRRVRLSVLQWSALAGLAVAAMVLGYVGYRERLHELGLSYGFLDIVYLDLHLFTFTTATAAGDPPYPWTLEVARFLAPVVGGFSALKALTALYRERFDQLRQLVNRDHVIVVGGGDKGRAVAATLLDAGKRVVLVDPALSPDDVGDLRAAGAVVTRGDGRDAAVLELAGLDRARAVVVLCGDDGTNADIAARVRDLVADRGVRGLTCVTHVADPGLCLLLRLEELERSDGDQPRFALDFVNVPDAAARALAAAHVSAPGGDVVLVVGWNATAAALVTALRRAAGTPATRTTERPRVVLAAPGACQAAQCYLAAHPGAVRDCVLTPVECDPSTLSGPTLPAGLDPAGITHAYVCGADDATTLQVALALDHRLDPAAAVTAVFRRRGGLASIADSAQARDVPRLRAFVPVESIASLDVLRPWTIEAIARATHDAYRTRRLAAGDRAAEDPAMRDWAQLAPALQDSNRAQARSVVDKLRRIGAVVVPDDDGANPSFVFTTGEVEQLARLEHARWGAERAAAGWVAGDRDVQAKRTPYLVEWEQLPEDVREYDREAVRAIPELLGVAGFRAVRAAPRDRS